MARAAVPEAAGERAAREKGFFGRILTFLREVIGELKKVVTPTRRELTNYVIIVLVFVAFMLLLISALDFVFGQGAFWLFGNGTAGPQ
ncbi:preprotein translocase subunit SecE [Rothia sp. AR01]|uniref:Protein translocase subunit SecE n=1 Tax=Rothia santali TaxID=2949643 RepID=A0A9X2KH23_9MICC|nr:preprotein translocase subunit SecE [Rothia santali]MCP3424763.1 preprotein translocase subunit SecE [Rothia santali]